MCPTNQTPNLLSDNHALKLSAHLEDLISRFNSSSRTDRARACEAITAAYELLGKEKPRIFWCESPPQMVLMASLLKEGVGRDTRFFDLGRTFAPVERTSKVMSRLWKQIDAQVDDSERAELHHAGKIKLDAAWIGRLKLPFSKDVPKPNAWNPLTFNLRTIGTQAGKELQGLLDRYFAEDPKYKKLKDRYQATRELTEIDPSRQINADVGQMTLLGFELPTDQFDFSRDELLKLAIDSITGNAKTAFDEFVPPQSREKYRLFMTTLVFNSLVWYPRWDLGLVPFYQFLLKELPDLPVGPTNKKRIRVLLDLASEGLCYLCYEGYVFVCECPVRMSVDQDGRLHSEFGPALSSLDGYALYSWHGSTVDKWIIEKPEKITVPGIMKETNAEVRRVMIDRYGMEKFIKGSGAQEIHRDECGILYSKELEGDEPLVIVKVKNSTPEPDGSYKWYFLRVPPHITTAREAVAWTFDMDPADYSPKSQT